MTFDFNKLDPQYSTIFLPLDEQKYYDSVWSTRSLSRQPNAPSTVIVGDGSSSATWPEQLWKRGMLFDGSQYLDLDWASGGVLDTQTFTVCALVQAERPAADGRIFEIGIAGQRYSLYYDLSGDQVVWEKDDTVNQTLTSSRGAQYGQLFSVVASVSSLAMKLYVNGELIDSISGDYRLASFDASSKAYFAQDVAGGNRFKGRIYVAAVYPFELNAPQVREWGRRADQLRHAGLWTPAALLVGATGVWGDWSTDADVTYNTQPTPNDWDMEAAGTAAWSVFGGAILTKDADAYAGTQSLKVEGAGTGATQVGAAIAGNRYLVSVAHKAVGGATAEYYYGSVRFLISSAATWSVTQDELTTSGTGLAFYNVGGTAVYADNFSATNLSLTQAAFRASTGALAGSVLEQATAASMSWWDDDAFGTGYGGLNFDGTADFMVSDAAASAWPLHKADGFTMSFAYKPDAAAAGTDTIIDTCDATNTNHGVTVEYDATNEQLTVKVANGSGTFEIDEDTGASTLTAGDAHYVSITWSETGGLRVLIDAAAAVTAASGGSASASDASATLQHGRTSGGANFLHGSCNLAFLRVGAVSDANLALLHADTKTANGL